MKDMNKSKTIISVLAILFMCIIGGVKAATGADVFGQPESSTEDSVQVEVDTGDVTVDTGDIKVDTDVEVTTNVQVDADIEVDTDIEVNTNVQVEIAYTFRSEDLLQQHFEKHGVEMGFETASDYEAAASAVINNPDSLSKIEAEDGDYVYYLEETNEFVVLSTDGYIRTYFYPSSGKAYYDRQ